MTVIADTGPVNYLILSGYIDLIQRLYGSLILPAAVHRELLHPKAPALVRQWTMTLPAWVDFRVPLDSSQFAELGPGEREAISLALETKAEILLMDETKGRSVAVFHGVSVRGVLAVLEEASAKRLIDLPHAIERLRATTMFLSDDVVQRVLRRDGERKLGSNT